MNSLKDILLKPRANQNGSLSDPPEPTKKLKTETKEAKNVKRPLPTKSAKLLSTKPVKEDTSEDEEEETKQFEEPKLNIPAMPKTKPPRFKRSAFESAKLIGLGYPVDRSLEAKNLGKKFDEKKKYRIAVTFKDETGMVRQRNVLFGNVDDKDYTETGNEQSRLRVVHTLGNTDNFLHPNFYRLWLMNSNEKSMIKACELLKASLNV